MLECFLFLLQIYAISDMYNKNCFYLKVSISDEVDCFMSGRKGKVCEDHLGSKFKSERGMQTLRYI